MKKVFLIVAGLCLFGQIHAVDSSADSAESSEKAGGVERAANAYKLLKGFAEILVLDAPKIEENLIAHQSNWSVLKENIKLQKEAIKGDKKKIPVTDIMVTTYLVISEFEGLINTVIYIVKDILQEKIILPFATIIGQTESDPKYIGKYFNKVIDVLTNGSKQLKEISSVLSMILGVIDQSHKKLNAQKDNLIKVMPLKTT